jgi:uncharacterized protein
VSERNSTDPAALAPLPSDLSIQYTLATGPHVGRVLTELANGILVGARCADCAHVIVPADEFCPRCGGEASELLAMPATGSVTAFTERDGVISALIRIDGAGVDLLHRLTGVAASGLERGLRVEAVWAAERTGSILDIEGFQPSSVAELGVPVPLGEPSGDVIEERSYALKLHYEHAYGANYGRLFDELKAARRIVGVRCPSCQSVLVPPRPVCEVCYVPTGQFEDVPDTGVLRAFSVIHLAFAGQVREPPYVYAEITLDGASTRLIHVLGGVDPDQAQAVLRPGLRVRAVWREAEPTGTLADIDHFALIDDV